MQTWVVRLQWPGGQASAGPDGHASGWVPGFGTAQVLEDGSAMIELLVEEHDWRSAATVAHELVETALRTTVHVVTVQAAATPAGLATVPALVSPHGVEDRLHVTPERLAEMALAPGFPPVLYSTERWGELRGRRAVDDWCATHPWDR